MAIEFTCHKCGGKLKTADQYGDRHGRCPFCRKLLKVPAASSSRQIDHLVGEATAEITASILEEAAAEVPLPPPRAVEPPDLGPEPVPMPGAPKEREAAPKQKAAPKKAARPPAPKDAKDAIKFECLLCGEEIVVGKEMAGKKMSCPGCGEQLTAPSN